jgi:hypothetical protein
MQKPKLEVLLGKSAEFDQIMAEAAQRAAERKKAAEAEQPAA